MACAKAQANARTIAAMRLEFFALFVLYRGLVARGPAGSAIKRIADEAILSDCWGKAPFGKKKTWIYRMSI